jgi:hypothetical protein
MPKYLFVAKRVTEYEDYIIADTQEDAEEIYDELIADDLTTVNQYFDYDVYGTEVPE